MDLVLCARPPPKRWSRPGTDFAWEKYIITAPMKRVLKRFAPEALLSIYHYGVALAAAVRYGFPSRHIVTIGITGTKGKTSSANFIWSCLSAGGGKTRNIKNAKIPPRGGGELKGDTMK